jgi:hypothetical protein
MCRAEFSLPSITAEEGAPEKKAPIRVKFEIPYFTVSGIQVISDFSVLLLSNSYVSFIVIKFNILPFLIVSLKHPTFLC